MDRRIPLVYRNGAMKRFLTTAVAFLGLTFAGHALAQADETSGAKFEVYPSDVNLNTAADSQSIVAQLVLPDGRTRDVTESAKFEPSDPKLVTINGHILK